MMAKGMRIWGAGLILLFAAVSLAGCPPVEAPGGDAKVVTLLGADAGAKLAEDLAKAAKADVAVDDIESLTITVTEVSLVPAGGDDDDAEDDGEEEGETDDGDDGESEGDTEKSGHVVLLLSEPLVVDLMDLTGLATVLSSAEIPAGTYNQIRLSYENPELMLKSDPETVIDDIQQTANGRLFITEQFEVPEGGSLLLVELSDLHLVQTGNGKLVFTPQLEATLDIVDPPVTATGTIVSVDAESKTMVVALAEGEVTVSYQEGTPVYLPGDVDGAPSGTVADLVANAKVTVEGLLTVGGTIEADVITITELPPPQV